MHAGQSNTRINMSGQMEETESNSSSFLFNARNRIVAQAGAASRWGSQEVERAALNTGMPVGIPMMMQNDEDDDEDVDLLHRLIFRAGIGH